MTDTAVFLCRPLVAEHHTLRSSALLALTKLMALDAAFCDTNLRLLFTLLQTKQGPPLPLPHVLLLMSTFWASKRPPQLPLLEFRFQISHFAHNAEIRFDQGIGAESADAGNVAAFIWTCTEAAQP